MVCERGELVEYSWYYLFKWAEMEFMLKSELKNPEWREIATILLNFPIALLQNSGSPAAFARFL